MLLRNRNIGFGITASYCTHNSVYSQIEALLDEGAFVTPIMSYNTYSCDTRFGSSVDFVSKIEALCQKKAVKTIVEAEPFGPRTPLDIMIVSPCTGNTLSKLANGITDTSVTMACKAQLRNQNPVVVGISTNDGLGINAKNIGTLLNTRNIYFIPFGQDDPMKKCNSLVAHFNMLLPTVLEALKGKQIQPVLLT